MNSAHRLRKKDPKVASSLAYATFKVGVLTNSMQMIEESIVMIKSLANRHPNCAVVFATYGHVSGGTPRVQLTAASLECTSSTADTHDIAVRCGLACCTRQEFT